jgi:hypothetical protein
MSNESGVYLETNSRTGETYILTINDDEPVPVHKLVAIAEHGIEAVEKYDIHHLNTTPWDNRPENLCLVEDSSDKEFAKRGYWKLVNGEPQLHLYNGTIRELAKRE